MKMLIKYVGDGYRVSFVRNTFYKARKVNDELGDGYAIFDEGEDWYRYGKKYVEKNFDVANAESEIEFDTAGSVAV